MEALRWMVWMFVLVPVVGLGTPAPVFEITFDGDARDGGRVGEVTTGVEGPRPPVHPSQKGDNLGARFGGDGARVVVTADAAGAGALGFTNGDTVTLEAWVAPEVIAEGANLYVVGKGRTHSPDFPKDNQNYALRVRGQNGQACPSFLFRSADGPGGEAGGYHRWTAGRGVVPGTGWHHVAVTYRFGDPGSIRCWIDGAAADGEWDMAGATSRAPVVDDYALWVGSALGGAAGNSFRGGIDAVRIYRSSLPEAMVAVRGSRVEPPAPPSHSADPNTIPANSVLVEIFEDGIPETRAWPPTVPTPSESYHDEAFGFSRYPQKYDAEGLRADRPVPFLFRATARVALPPGEHRLLVRAHHAARVTVDGERAAEIPFPKRFHDAHADVSDQFLDLAPDLRFAAPGGLEKVVPLTSDGSPQLVVYETIVGQISGKAHLRPELGESALAVGLEGETTFRLLSPARDIPFTDAGWQSYSAGRERFFDASDADRRRAAAASQDPYWENRHVLAREVVASLPPLDVPDLPHGFAAHNPIDHFLAARITDARHRAREHEGTTVRFHRDILPVLESKCFSCHRGEKIKGGLRMGTRADLLAGGESGEPAVVPGDASASLLVHLVAAADEADLMPPKGDPLTTGEVALVTTWVEEGAPWPESPVIDNITVPGLADDLTFLRRLALDTVGVPPSPAEMETFFAAPPEQRRAAAMERFLADPRWADHWVSYWQDVLAENPNILKPTLNNTGPFRWFIHEALADNKPVDRFVSELVMMKSGRYAGGPAAFAVATQNDVPMAAKAAVLGSAFLGLQMKCARCHDAPYHNLKQEDLFNLAAMLARKPIELPATSSVPKDKLARQPLITISLEPGTEIGPAWPFGELAPENPGVPLSDPGDRRERLAAILTSPQNWRFAQVVANRVWERFTGRGIVGTVDDWEDAVPSHPGLLEFLAREFVSSGYDLKALSRLILSSHAYQREAVPQQDPGAAALFASPLPRRLTAEQVVDSLFATTGNAIDTEPINFDIDIDRGIQDFLNLGQPRRAWEFASLSNERDRPSLALPRAQAVVDVLQAFGWRGSRPEPTSARAHDPNVLQPATMANGTVTTWVTRLTDGSGLTTTALEARPAEELVDAVFLQILTRHPTGPERAAAVALLAPGYDERAVPPSLQPPPDPAPRRPRPYIAWSNHLSPRANALKLELESEAREGDPPTERLYPDWRERFEDLVWSLVNSPEFVFYR